MKVIKIFNEEGITPSFANPTDSGLDIMANGLDIVIVGMDKSLEEYKEEITLIDSEYCKSVSFDENAIMKKFNLEFLRHMYRLVDDGIIIFKIFFRYMTGTRTILPLNTDAKGKPKSSKFKKAPYLDSLQNDDGVIDEEYRGIIQYIYEFNSIVLFQLMRIIHDDRKCTPKMVELISRNIYLPSLTKAVGQLVPENREDYEIQSVPAWSKELEATSRGTGGHGSSNR
jgi:dUTPase